MATDDTYINFDIESGTPAGVIQIDPVRPSFGIEEVVLPVGDVPAHYAVLGHRLLETDIIIDYSTLIGKVVESVFIQKNNHNRLLMVFDDGSKAMFLLHHDTERNILATSCMRLLSNGGCRGKLLEIVLPTLLPRGPSQVVDKPSTILDSMGLHHQLLDGVTISRQLDVVKPNLDREELQILTDSGLLRLKYSYYSIVVLAVDQYTDLIEWEEIPII